MEMCLGISIVNFAYSYDHQIRFLHISGTHWPTTPIVSHTKKDIRTHLCKADIRHTHFCWFQQQKLRISTAEPAVLLPLHHHHIFFFHVSSTVNGFAFVEWVKIIYFTEDLFHHTPAKLVFWRRVKRQLIAKLCRTQKVLGTVIVFSLLLLFWTGSQSSPPFPIFFSFPFLSFLSMDINLLWSHLQYPSVSQWISFLINFLPNFLYE